MLLAFGAFSGLGGCIYFFVEGLIKALNHAGPIQVSFGNFIKLFFNRSCEVEIHDVLEILFQEIIDYDTNICWEKFVLFKSVILRDHFTGDFFALQYDLLHLTLLPLPLFFNHILPMLNRRYGWCICGRPSDSKLFHFFHQAGFGVSCRLLGGLFVGFDFIPLKGIIDFHWRQ